MIFRNALALLRGLGVAAFALVSGCASPESSSNDAQSPAIDAGASDAGAPVLDQLVGKWVSSDAPAVNLGWVTLTFSAGKTLRFVVDFEPWTTPAGFVAAQGCVTLGTFDGTYTSSLVNGYNTLSWKFVSGTVNQVANCDDPALDEPGTPVNDVTDIIRQGHLPPTNVTYITTSTTLTLVSPNDPSSGLGRNPGTTFTRAP